jgi:hypothetical protein
MRDNGISPREGVNELNGFLYCCICGTAYKWARIESEWSMCARWRVDLRITTLRWGVPSSYPLLLQVTTNGVLQPDNDPYV